MGLRVGLVGVGPVGDMIVRVLKERSFPMDGEIVVMATGERTEMLGGESILVRKISADLFRELDVVFFAGKEGAQGASVQWGKIAIDNGCVVIDNGGDFRMHPDYPLVIPEVNMDVVTKDTRHICNPNCSTIQMVVSLAPLHRAARLRRIVVSTYQAVSGFGGAAMNQLMNEMNQAISGKEPETNPKIFTHPIALNCIPHIDKFLANGYTKEEMKMINETRKILNEPNLLINPTTVRVPALVGHSESINVEFTDPMTAERAMQILSDINQSPGVIVIDGPTQDSEGKNVRKDPLERRYPVAGDLRQDPYKDAVLVGRIRDDSTIGNAINLWCVSDNLRKGAATNAVQIAEAMLERGLL